MLLENIHEILMINLYCQPELVAKCIIGRDSKETIRNAAILSLTSKVMQTFINSDEFFKAYAQIMDAGHFLPKINQTLSSFKTRCFELRGLCLKKTEEFPGVTLGDAWVDEDGVNLFSFFKELGHYKLRDSSGINSIAFPENTPLDLSNCFNEPPSIARSKEYLAIHGSDSHVYIFKSDGKKYFDTYDVGENIKQIAIQDNRLYVLKNTESYSLMVINLENDMETFITFVEDYDPSTPICFGKAYLIYSSKLIIGNGVMACSLSNLHEKIYYANLAFGQAYFYPMQDGFIEVFFGNTFVCDIFKISFEEGLMKKTIIKNDLKISEGFLVLRTDVCFHNDRLLVAYRESGVGTKIFSYDLLLDCLSELTSISSQEFYFEEWFKPRFLCLAEKVYYLYMTSPGNDEHKSSLSTFTFSKI